jgi:acyl-CoA thioesterase FadM
VHVDCDYRAPISFGDEIEVSMTVSGMGKSSLTYSFALKKSSVICAEGSMVIVRAGGHVAPDVPQ